MDFNGLTDQALADMASERKALNERIAVRLGELLDAGWNLRSVNTNVYRVMGAKEARGFIGSVDDVLKGLSDEITPIIYDINGQIREIEGELERRTEPRVNG